MSDSTGDFDVSDLLKSPCSHSTNDCEPPTLPVKRGREEFSEAGFEPGSEEYRKARKRRQNRESAARTRARKVDKTKSLEVQVGELEQDNLHLRSEVQSLTLTLASLQQDLDYYRDLALGLRRAS